MSYLYIPFANREQNQDLRRMATEWVAAVASDRRGKNQPEIKIHGTMPYLLDSVSPDEVLYVLAHGNPFSDEYVASLRTLTTPVISYETLADRLVADGLPKIHKVIKLYICSAEGKTKTFAENFFCEMEQLGYHRIEVYYYEASVSTPRLWGDGLYHKEGVHEDLLRLGVYTQRFRASEVRKKV